MQPHGEDDIQQPNFEPVGLPDTLLSGELDRVLASWKDVLVVLKAHLDSILSHSDIGN